MPSNSKVKKWVYLATGYTYSGHPVACAVALKTLEIYQRDGVFAHAEKVGQYLQSKLAAFKRASFSWRSQR